MRIKRLFFFLLTSHFSKAYLGEAKTILVGTRKNIYYVWAWNKIQHRRLYIKSFNGTIYMYISLKCNIIQRNIIKINMNSRRLIKKKFAIFILFPRLPISIFGTLRCVNLFSYQNHTFFYCIIGYNPFLKCSEWAWLWKIICKTKVKKTW